MQHINVALEINLQGDEMSVHIATQDGASVAIWPSQLPFVIGELQANLAAIQAAQAEAAPK